MDKLTVVIIGNIDCVPLGEMNMRRRKITLGISFLLVTVVAASLFFYRPTRTAMSVLTLPPTRLGAPESEAQIHAQTHVALIQRPFVINAAMSRSDIRQLAVVRRQERPAEWVESQLDVALQNQSGGGTAQVTLTTREGNTEELKLIVDAIAEAYQREIVARESAAQ